jgi:glycosyltransferase involved in cell wall biosynthesis
MPTAPSAQAFLPTESTEGRLTVVQLVPALDSGGAERSTLEIAAALVRAGHRSFVISGGGRLVEQLEHEGSRHIKVPIGNKRPWTLRHISTLRRIFDTLEPDVAHARSRLPAWLAWLAMRRMPLPPRFITTVHGLNSPGRYSGILLKGERVICVSETVRQWVAQHYAGVEPDKLVVVPRGVDPAAFPRGHRPSAEWRATIERQHPALAGVPLLLLPARGTRLKNHADAIEVLARLREAHGIEAGLWLLGARDPGREAYVAELEAHALKRGVATRVAITEPRADNGDAYGMAAVVLQVSGKPESFGRTVVEALSVGVPVAGYAHGGVGELLRELQPAGAVALGDVEALASVVANWLRHPPEVPSPARYRLAQMQEATLALYTEIVEAWPD